MKRALVVLVAAFAIPMARPVICSAAENNATVIVETAPGQTTARCVGFEGAQTTALDLLERTGLGVQYQDFGAGNVFVCRIAGTGCDYPRESCTCAYGDRKVFWGMYLVEQDTWTFAQTGAGTTSVRDGAVVGWRWGEHGADGVPPAAQPKTRCTAADAVTVPPEKGGGVPVSLLVVAAVLVALIAVALVARARRTPEEPQ